MNFIQATNTPIKIELGGERYSVRFLNFRELAPVSAWIEEHVPSPLANATQTIQKLRSAGKSPDSTMEELLLDHAMNQMLSWPPKVGTEPWFDALDGTDGGLAELVYTILSKTVVGFDRDKARTLSDKMSREEVLELAYLGVYGIRRKKDEAADEPEVAQEAAPKEEGLVASAGPTGVQWGAWRE